jgi:hypothetical protein
MVHHYMLKEAHIISYIQQVSHKWIEGDEEETIYGQATKSLRVVPTDIQNGPKVFTHVQSNPRALVKALSNFENMEIHGEPIKLIISSTIHLDTD